MATYDHRDDDEEADRLPTTREEMAVLLGSIRREQREQRREFEDWRRDVDKAFPLDLDGTPDYRGHRAYHQRLITKAGSWDRIVERIAGSAIWATLVALLLAAGTYIKEHWLRT
jgi:hypothetical protein